MRKRSKGKVAFNISLDTRRHELAVEAIVVSVDNLF